MYRIPAGFSRTETEVAKSRFIATVGYITTSEEAKAFLANIRSEMPDASHHVYAFRAGYGKTVLEGMSDDGEPSGTAGPPVLSILRGSDIGDIIIVITRYFGGTKLGTGGLVRAYSESAHVALNNLELVEKIDKTTLGVDISYSLFELTKRLIIEHNGEIIDEIFAGDVTIIAEFPTTNVDNFSEAIKELSAGKYLPIIL